MRFNWKTDHIGGDTIVSSPVLLCHVWKHQNVALEQQLCEQDDVSDDDGGVDGDGDDGGGGDGGDDGGDGGGGCLGGGGQSRVDINNYFLTDWHDWNASTRSGEISRTSFYNFPWRPIAGKKLTAAKP